MDRSNGRSADDERTVRTYQPGDAERFRSLYETVWDATKRRAWFDWRFEANPHADGVEMVVAEEDGRLVGAEPLVPYRLRAGDRRLRAYQPVDWIVHPDHRREGVFSAMTEFLLERAAEDAALLFNFPNEQLRPGIERFGWEVVDTVAARYRVQDAHAAVAASESVGSRLTASALATAGRPIVSGGLGMLDRVGSAPEDVAVDRVDGVPIETVHELYRRNVPDRLHVPRERSYLAWRFGNPRWETTTYVARRDGDPVASVVVAVESVDGTRLARLLDVQPMTDERGDPAAFGAILERVVADHAEADVIKAPPGTFPEVCRRFGFFRDDAFPFSRVSSTTFHAVRVLDGGDGVEADASPSESVQPADRIAVDADAHSSGSGPGGSDRSGSAPSGSGAGTIADGSGGRAASGANVDAGTRANAGEREGAPLAASAERVPVDLEDRTRTIDLTDPDDWILALGDRDVA